MRYVLGLALALTCFFGAAPACRTPGTISRDPERTTVRVDNQAALDMTIYAMRFGQRVRLGTVTAHSSQVLQIPASLLTGSATTLRFIADPIGSTTGSVGEEITVMPGDQVVLTIPR